VRIAFVVERPTQFEAPFYRFVATDSAHELRVLFTGPEPGRAVHDAEMDRAVDWGFDLLAGYVHEVVPPAAGPRWWRERLAALDADLLVVNGYTRRAYLRAAWAGRRRARRIALRIDTVLFDRRPSVVRRALVGRVLAAIFDRFLATGTLTRRYLEACGVPAARIGIFPYAIDVTAFREGARLGAAARRAVRERFGVPAAAKLVLAVAKLSPREAPWDLLRAAAADRRDGTVYLIAGEGPLRVEVERFVAEHALATSVRLAGYVPYAALPGLYAAADAFVHAPREERWGVSVAEALAAGRPVVASTRVGAAHDLVTPGASGFVYAAGQPGELLDRVRAALALDPARVAAAAAERLEAWNYAASWRHLLEAAG